MNKSINSTRKNKYLEASATVEAALVMPLFIYAVAALIYLLRIIEIKQDISVAAYNAVRTVSGYGYVTEDMKNEAQSASDSSDEFLKNLVTDVSVYSLIIKDLGVDYCKNNYIVGGNMGIVVTANEPTYTTETSNELISVTVSYTVKNPFDIFGLGLVSISQTYNSLVWVGDKGIPSDVKNARNEPYVYITQYGEVYHTKRECAYINLSVMSVPIMEVSEKDNMGGIKYTPCEVCEAKKSEHQEIVYITEYGEKYHTEMNCRAIKRTIMEIPFSKVGSKKRCSKCAVA